jgi:hypothetical protein
MMPTHAPISAAQVQIYADFDGDEDTYQRRGSPQRALMSHAWGTIEDLRRRLFLAAAGRASVKFSALAEADLLSLTSDETARQMIRAIVANDVARSNAV